jgi:hypothetical protein
MEVTCEYLPNRSSCLVVNAESRNDPKKGTLLAIATRCYWLIEYYPDT